MNKLSLVTNDINKYNKILYKISLVIFLIAGFNTTNTNVDSFSFIIFMPTILAIIDAYILIVNRKFIRLITQDFQNIIFAIFKKYLVLIFCLIPGYLFIPIFQLVLKGGYHTYLYSYNSFIPNIILILFIFIIIVNLLFNSNYNYKVFIKNVLIYIGVLFIMSKLELRIVYFSPMRDSLMFAVPAMYILIYTLAHIKELKNSQLRPIITLCLYAVSYIIPLYFSTTFVLYNVLESTETMIMLYLVVLLALIATNVCIQNKFSITFNKKINIYMYVTSIIILFILLIIQFNSQYIYLSSLIILSFSAIFLTMFYFNFKLINFKRIKLFSKVIKEKIDVWI